MHQATSYYTFTFSWPVQLNSCEADVQARDYVATSCTSLLLATDATVADASFYLNNLKKLKVWENLRHLHKLTCTRGSELQRYWDIWVWKVMEDKFLKWILCALKANYFLFLYQLLFPDQACLAWLSMLSPNTFVLLDALEISGRIWLQKWSCT